MEPYGVSIFWVVPASVASSKTILSNTWAAREHPFNQGFICTKGAMNREYIYRKDRIRTPLRRVGKRGEGKFEPVTWEEAYQEIAKTLSSLIESHIFR